VCFERAAAPADPAALVAAMRRTLNAPDADIELLDWIRTPVPAGEFVFPKDSLLPSSAGSNLWNGWVWYEPRKRARIWARVRLRVYADRWVAAMDLAPGALLTAGGIRQERRSSGPEAEPPLALAEIIGRRARTAVRAGQEIRGSMLADAMDIRRGETVEVHVSQGAARLRLTAIASADAKRGQWTTLRNPENGNRFQARVAGPGLVEIKR
jgi:flagella basal body P-ring formation protein FlgA